MKSHFLTDILREEPWEYMEMQYIGEIKQIRGKIMDTMRKTVATLTMSASLVSDAEQLRQLIKRDNTY